MQAREDPSERPVQDAELVIQEVKTRSRATMVFAILFAAGLVGLALVAAAPLGLVDPYPPLPPAAVEGPLGSTRVLEDPSELNRREGEALPDYFDRLAGAVAFDIVRGRGRGRCHVGGSLRMWMQDHGVLSSARVLVCPPPAKRLGPAAR